jgi:hypothetical protein
MSTEMFGVCFKMCFTLLILIELGCESCRKCCVSDTSRHNDQDLL